MRHGYTSRSPPLAYSMTIHNVLVLVSKKAYLYAIIFGHEIDARIRT